MIRRISWIFLLIWSSCAAPPTPDHGALIFEEKQVLPVEEFPKSVELHLAQRTLRLNWENDHWSWQEDFWNFYPHYGTPKQTLYALLWALKYSRKEIARKIYLNDLRGIDSSKVQLLLEFYPYWIEVRGERQAWIYIFDHAPVTLIQRGKYWFVLSIESYERR